MMEQKALEISSSIKTTSKLLKLSESTILEPWNLIRHLQQLIASPLNLAKKAVSQISYNSFLSPAIGWGTLPTFLQWLAGARVDNRAMSSKNQGVLPLASLVDPHSSVWISQVAVASTAASTIRFKKTNICSPAFLCVTAFKEIFIKSQSDHIDKATEISVTIYNKEYYRL